MVLTYVIDVYPETDYETLMAEAQRHLSKEQGDEAMTIAQQLEQRGMQQGMQQEKFMIAKKLLKLNTLKLDDIAQATDLSIEELKKIQQQELEIITH